MNYQDYLAWSILAVFYLVAGVPFAGSLVTSTFSTYKEDWNIGACIHIVLAGVAIVALSIIWAFARVYGEA